MANRRMFRRPEIFQALETISTGLDSEMKAYLIGGLAMMVHGIKIATKDIDVVLATGDEASVFKASLRGFGFEELEDLPSEYQDLEASSIMQRSDGMRFDIFVGSVCGCLVLTEGIKGRAVELRLPGNMRLMVVSQEDIFLLKSVSGRDDDLQDMAMLAGGSLEWSTIEAEIENQPDSWRWLGHTYENLMELGRKHGVTTPLTTRFEKEAEIIAGIAVLSAHIARGPISREEASDAIGDGDGTFVADVLGKMVELGLAVEQKGMFSKGSK